MKQESLLVTPWFKCEPHRMECKIQHSLPSLLFPLLLSLTLLGCPVPIPPGYDSSSRENLSSEATVNLVPGITTREDILLKFGEADGAAEDGSWLAYGSIYGKGGVIFVVAAGGGAAGAGAELTEYSRLVVTFDDKGILKAADFVSRDCWDGIAGFGSQSGTTPPCIDVFSPESSE